MVKTVANYVVVDIIEITYDICNWLPQDSP